MAAPLPPDTFLSHAQDIMGRSTRAICVGTEAKHFRGLFGTCPLMCSILWERIDPYVEIARSACPIHLLCALLFLNVYGTEIVHATMVGVDEKTFRKWV
jgi:hypothetical protein